MNRKTATAFAAALLLVSASAFAGTAKTTKAAMPAKTEKTATIHKTSAKQTAHKVAMHKAKAPHHAWRHKQAGRKRAPETLGDRETNALNALELAGYSDVQGMHAKGANIVASVEKNKKRTSVTVMPDGTVHPAA